MAIPYEELGLTLSFGLEQATAKRIVKIAWADIQAFIVEQFGATFWIQGYDTTYTMQHPDWGWLLLSGLDFEPMADVAPSTPGDRNYASGAKVTMTYTANRLRIGNSPEEPPDASPGTTVTWNIDGTREDMLVPGYNFVWASDGKEIGEDVGVPIHIQTEVHRFTWSNVTSPPWAVIKAAIGMVNTSSFLGFDAECCMFESYSGTWEYDQNGEKNWTITYTFHGRHGVSFNELWHRGVGFDTPVDPVRGEKIYQTSSLFPALFYMA